MERMGKIALRPHKPVIIDQITDYFRNPWVYRYAPQFPIGSFTVLELILTASL
jgi:hypothetical protein